MKKYLIVILSCLIIGITYNLFFEPFNLVPSGILGIGTLFKYTYGGNIAVFIAIANIILLFLSILILGVKQTKKYLLSSLLIPFFIFITKNISKIIDLSSVELLIIAISGAALIGYSHLLIYNEGFSIGGFEIIQDMFNKSKLKQNSFLFHLIDFSVIILCLFILNFESAIYTTIITIIISYLSTKAKVGISSSKTFFIITTKENEVKDYLIKDLKYDFTEFNVKGGFTNQKNRIIMTVIDTKDYYRIKEGVSLIDDKAFISIIDNYEKINSNRKISKEYINNKNKIDK